MDGNTFEFSAMETTVGANIGYRRTSVTYKLTKVELYNGKTIEFEYQDGFYESQTYSESFHTEYPFYNDGTPMIDKHSDEIKHYIKMLSRIKTDETIIDFNFDDRVDLYTERIAAFTQNMSNFNRAKKIASVDIKNAQTLKKLSF
jgi:hypothetical protein